MRPFWPAAAIAAQSSGVVRLSCRVQEHRAEACTVVDERPAGMGFGAATLAASRLFRIRPVMRGGKAIDWPVIVETVWSSPPRMVTPPLQ